MKILNAFSLSMLPSLTATVSTKEISLAEAQQYAAHALHIESGVGHADTAALFTRLLDVNVPCNRVSVLLAVGDLALVGQYTGLRLPEGTLVLPEGAAVKWVLVLVGPVEVVDYPGLTACKYYWPRPGEAVHSDLHR